MFNPSSMHGPGPGGPRLRPSTKSNRSSSDGDQPKEKTPRWDSLRRGVSQTWTSTVRVFRLVWQTSKWQTLALAILTLLLAVIPAAQVWLAGALIDEVADGITAGDADPYIRPIVILAIAQLVLFLAGSLFQTLSNIDQQLLQEKLTIHVQQIIMRHANSLDLADFENATYYDQLQQAQRESANRPVQMVSGVFGLARSIITFATMVGLLVGLSPWIAVAALISPIPAFISGSRYSWWGFQQMRRLSPTRRMMSYLTTVLTTDSFNKEIKLYTLGDHFIDRYDEISQGYYEETRSLLVRRYLAGFGWGALTIVASSATFLYVAVQAVRGVISLGQLTVFTQAAQQVQNSFQGLLGGFQSIYEHGLYLSTLYDLLDREPQISAPDNPVPVRVPFEKGIEFRNVTFTYPGRPEPALNDVSFKIDLGETVAVVGKNGAGKSTIVKLLGRLYDPEKGQILVDGVDVRDYDPAELRKQFGMMFQDYAMYQLPVSENIGVGNVARVRDHEAIESAATRGGATRLIESLPDRYDTVLGKWFEDGHQLSGGEWQRVALSRAFMRDAQILILDEPTSALDAEAEYDLFARIKQLAEGRMAIFISHRFSTTRRADRILVLENAKLIEQGTHAELMMLGGRYSELFNLQAESYLEPLPATELSPAPGPDWMRASV
ncbi:MAG TPA: ABC transporter ATP-binding protein [Thermomicrobiales bacterium]|nr:ABC transporter ATP-binding protein [Thermomicrobiales bacterium]